MNGVKHFVNYWEGKKENSVIGMCIVYIENTTSRIKLRAIKNMCITVANTK